MKTVSTILAGFFVLLLAGGFILGDTSFGSLFGASQTTIAKINGEEIPYYQYQKFYKFFREQKRDDKEFDEKGFQDEVMNRMIDLYRFRHILRNWGFEPTSEALRDFYLQQFKVDGKFDKDRLLAYRRFFNLNDDDFTLLLEQSNFTDQINDLVMITPDEALQDLIAEKTNIQINYIHLATIEWNQRIDKGIKIDATKLNEGIAKEKAKRIADAQSDKTKKVPDDAEIKRIVESRLRNEERSKEKNKLRLKLQEEIKKNGTLEALSKIAGFPVYQSQLFHPGDRIARLGSKTDYATGLDQSPLFLSKILTLKKNELLGPIPTNSGEYFVTLKQVQYPDAKSIKQNQPKEEKQRKRMLEYYLRSSIAQDIYMNYRNSMKIERYDAKFFKDSNAENSKK